MLDIVLGLIWIQTAFKGYQQTTLVGKELIAKDYILVRYG